MADQEASIPEDMQELHQCLKEWQGTNRPRSPLPNERWAMAVGLAQRHNVHRVGLTFGLDYGGLNRRMPGSIPKPTASFVAHSEEGRAAGRVGRRDPRNQRLIDGSMLQIPAPMRILAAIEPVDFRKGMDALAPLCQQKLETDPFSGCLFLFRSRSAILDRAKTLVERTLSMVAGRQRHVAVTRSTSSADTCLRPAIRLSRVRQCGVQRNSEKKAYVSENISGTRLSGDGSGVEISRLHFQPRQRDGGCLEYRMEHVLWRLWQSSRSELVCDATRFNMVTKFAIILSKPRETPSQQPLQVIPAGSPLL
jgi:hypothetical protein